MSALLFYLLFDFLLLPFFLVLVGFFFFCHPEKQIAARKSFIGGGYSRNRGKQSQAGGECS